MGRAPCCDKANVKRGPWSPEEDSKLKSYIQDHGTGGNWIALPQKIGLKRCGKSCRLRWLNYLRPNIKHGGFSDEEDQMICTLYMTIGSRWSIIAAQLPGRTDNDIKNYWNTKLKKKLVGKQRKELQQSIRRSSFLNKQQDIMMVKKEKSKDFNFMPPVSSTSLNPINPMPYSPHIAMSLMVDPLTNSNQNQNQEPTSCFHTPYDHIFPMQNENLSFPTTPNSITCIDYTTSITTGSNCFQLPNTHYSNDFHGFDVSNFPIDQTVDETTMYGLMKTSSNNLCGLDMANNGTCCINGATTNSAESTTTTSSWGGADIISSFVCSPILSNSINIFDQEDDENPQGIMCAFDAQPRYIGIQ